MSRPCRTDSIIFRLSKNSNLKNPAIFADPLYLRRCYINLVCLACHPTGGSRKAMNPRADLSQMFHMLQKVGTGCH